MLEKFEEGKEYFFDEESFYNWYKKEYGTTKGWDHPWLRRMTFKENITFRTANVAYYGDFIMLPQWCVEKGAK